MHRVLTHGQLAAELRALSEQRFRPPGAHSTRTYSVPTLQRWLYAYRSAGLDGLRPQPRSDRGFAQELSEELRALLLDIRREHPDASVPLILKTLVDEGRLEAGKVSEPTVRRLYAAHGLRRRAARAEGEPKTRLRWQAERPGALWHGDVCHVTGCTVGGKAMPIRIHGLLDDASRYVVALEAHTTEKEVDMLGMTVDALRRHGKPDALYLDNGSTYRGDILKTACARLGITLLHAKPYDPEARGKMERFWRTLREGCLNYLGAVASLVDINTTLRAFLDRRYHPAPHAGLLGRARRRSTQPAPPETAPSTRRRYAARSPSVPGAVSRATTSSLSTASLGSSTRATSLARSSLSTGASSRRTSRRGSSTRASALCCIRSTRSATRGASGLRAEAQRRISRRARWTSTPRGRSVAGRAMARTPARPEVERERVVRPLLHPVVRPLLQGDPGRRAVAAALQGAARRGGVRGRARARPGAAGR
ncbi:DDE-type integrase/transposase/recombinase [Sorangium sp. So ce1153]